MKKDRAGDVENWAALSALGVFVLLYGLLIGAGIVDAQEKADLTTPQTVTVASYEIAGIELRRLPRWTLRIVYMDDQGVEHYDLHQDDEAQALIIALNKADLSTMSLERRALQHLINEGKIPDATITGTPR